MLNRAFAQCGQSLGATEFIAIFLLLGLAGRESPGQQNAKKSAQQPKKYSFM
jgi:hypothetical protein